MFDQVTENSIAMVPKLRGLETSSLAEELTRVQIEIAHYRLILTDERQSAADSLKVIERLSRLSATLEGYVALDLAKDYRRSVALIAACARQLVTSFTRLLGSVGRGPIDSGEIEAIILYLIAERSVDAQEIARKLDLQTFEMGIASKTFAEACCLLASGKLQSVIELSLPETVDSANELPEHLLYRELLRGLQQLSRVGLGEITIEEGAAIKFFENVQLIGRDQFQMQVGDQTIYSTSIYTKPVHLATLLVQLSKILPEAFVTLVPTPRAASAENWRSWIVKEAKSRPFLWPNHIEALKSGYLNRGMSMVMTTPTGSGKSTLAALKIAACLSSGAKVVFIAPTHALVKQIENDLAIRMAGLLSYSDVVDVDREEEVVSLPSVSIVTPERCLALLAFAGDIFQDVGLLVFDECHLLSASVAAGNGHSRVGRRNVDAMMCLLNFVQAAPTVDILLLSAMVENGAEIADWISEILGKRATHFDGRWKPTRQVRSCLVYDKEELAILRQRLKRKEKFEPKAKPFGLFNLTRSWDSKRSDSLLLRVMSSESVPLATNASKSRLTSNRNTVAAELAAKFALRGAKVLVFCESVNTCGSVSKTVNARLKNQAVAHLSNDEELRRAEIVSVIGNKTGIYDIDGVSAGVHHGELFPLERELVEDRFRRIDSGLNVLAATSTLAQGLNLPCDVVILAGTDRLDENSEGESTRMTLAQHEILNALGRAGRAGYSSVGLSVVIPANPIGIVKTALEMHDEDTELQSIFATDDRCTSLVDPICLIMDRIEEGHVGSTELYLLRKLAPEREGAEERIAGMLRRSLGYRVLELDRGSGQASKWLDARVHSLMTREGLTPDGSDVPGWLNELSIKTGVSQTLISHVARACLNMPISSSSAHVWLTWICTSLQENDESVDMFFRPESLEKVFSRAYLNTPLLERQKFGKALLLDCLGTWLEGSTVIALEKKIVAFIRAYEGDVLRATSEDKKSKHGRRFVLRLIPDLVFLCGMCGQVVSKYIEQSDKSISFPTILHYLPQLLREGVDTIYHLAAIKRLGLSRSEAMVALANSHNLVMSPYDSLGRAEAKVTKLLAT